MQWHDLKTVLLEAAASRLIPVARLNSALEGLRAYLRIADQSTKVTAHLHALNRQVEGEAEAAAAAG